MNPDKIAENLAAAWNASDGDAWAAAFTENAVFVDVLARRQRGRDVIAREHRAVLDTIYLGSRLEVRVLETRPLADELELVHTATTLTAPDGPRAGVTESVQTMIVRDGLIEAFHNTIRTEVSDFADGDPALAARSPLEWEGRTV